MFHLSHLLPSNKLFAQFSVFVPGNPQPFSLDFAYPSLGVGVECDGKIWHEEQDKQQRDQMRDQKLASIGWRVLRFKESALSDHPDAVRDTIYKNLVEAEKSRKKAAENNNDELKKYSSQYIEDNEILLNKDLKIKINDLPNNIGELWLIGLENV